MDENEELRELVSQAQSHPDRSAQRRITLNKLVVKIRQSPSLRRPINPANIPNYQDIYDEALNRTCLEICRRIGSYNREYPVMAWVNNILNYRIQDVIDEDRKKGITYLPKDYRPMWWEIDRPKTNDDNSPSNEETILPPSANADNQLFNQQQTKTIREFIIEDPDGRLKEKHIEGIPEATFQSICLMNLDGLTWDEIAATLGSKYQTVTSFYKRRLKDLLDYLQQELGDLLDYS